MAGETANVLTVIVLLPRFYNPDEHGQRKRVEKSKFRATGRQITMLMTERWGEGGCTLDEDPKKGFWGRKEVIYEDDMLALELDSFPDTGKDRAWILEYCAKTLCERFCQEAILVKFCKGIEVCTVGAVKGIR